MQELFPFAIVAAIWGFQFLMNWSAARSRRQYWRQAAAEADLMDLEDSWNTGGRTLRGRTPTGLWVRFENHSVNKNTTGTRVVVEVPGAHGLAIRPEIRHDIVLFGRNPEIEIGETTFDSTFRIEGVPIVAQGLLDAKTRLALLTLHSNAIVDLTGGELHAAARDGSNHLVPLLLRQSVEAGGRLEDRNVAKRLIKNSGDDPVPLARLRSLLLVIREFRRHPETDNALRAAGKDKYPEVRLRAALALGAEGQGTLLELAEGTRAEDRHTNMHGLASGDQCGAEAVAALDTALRPEQTIAILTQSLKSRRIETARACLPLLARSDDPDVVDLFAKILAIEAELAVAAAQALGTMRTTAAEAPLIAALEQEFPELRVAAADALGAVGTVNAVLPLKEAADRLSDREFRRAARQAIAEIQSRAGGASPGQLSVAASESGQLSVAETDAGQVSIAFHESGPIAMPGGEPGRGTSGSKT